MTWGQLVAAEVSPRLARELILFPIIPFLAAAFERDAIGVLRRRGTYPTVPPVIVPGNAYGKMTHRRATPPDVCGAVSAGLLSPRYTNKAPYAATSIACRFAGVSSEVAWEGGMIPLARSVANDAIKPR